MRSSQHAPTEGLRPSVRRERPNTASPWAHKPPAASLGPRAITAHTCGLSAAPFAALVRTRRERSVRSARPSRLLHSSRHHLVWSLAVSHAVILGHRRKQQHRCGVRTGTAERAPEGVGGAAHTDGREEPTAAQRRPVRRDASERAARKFGHHQGAGLRETAKSACRLTGAAPQKTPRLDRPSNRDPRAEINKSCSSTIT